jgi:hypothetical protein
MKSPFPGMDPYLEEHWRDIHHSFLTYARDDLQQRMPQSLRAPLEERVFVEPDEGPGRGIYPDVRVVEYPSRRPTAESGSVSSEQVSESSVALAESIVIHGQSEPATEGYIEIIDTASGNRVVTVIELLSASNKFAGDGQEKYLQKQREYARGGVSLVEIDLLRSGKRVLAVPGDRVPRHYRTPYQVCVSRGWQPGQWQVYRMPLRRALPTIQIPLRQTDAEVPLDLQSLIDRCYYNGRYDDIDYATAPNPALDPDDAQWAAELLKGQGLR